MASSLPDNHIVRCMFCNSRIVRAKHPDGGKEWLPLQQVDPYVYRTDKQQAQHMEGIPYPVLVDHRPICRVLRESKQNTEIKKLQARIALLEDGEVIEDVRDEEEGNAGGREDSGDHRGRRGADQGLRETDGEGGNGGDGVSKTEGEARADDQGSPCCPHGPDDHPDWGQGRPCLAEGCDCSEWKGE